MNITCTTTLVSRTELDKEKLKILGIFVRRMFDAKGNPKGNWRNQTWLMVGNSIVATLNDVMEHSLSELQADLTPTEKTSLQINGETA